MSNVFPSGVHVTYNTANTQKRWHQRPRKVSHPCCKYICSMAIVYLRQTRLAQANYMFQHILGLFGLHPPSLPKSAGFVFLSAAVSGKASLVSTSAAILLLRSWHVYLLLEFEFAIREKLCWMRAWRRRWHLLSPTLYVIIVYRVNLNKLSRNFVGVIRTTTTNCRVSFIDLYLVFPTNFRIVFYPIQTL